MPEKEALLIIDVINSCCNREFEKPGKGITFSRIRKMVPLLRKYVSKHRKKGGRIIFVTCTPWTREFLPRNIRALYDCFPSARYYSDDSTGKAEDFYLVRPVEGEKVFRKSSYDAFTNPSLSKFLWKNKIETLLIAGVFSDACVNATINGAFSKGFSIKILGDLVETTDSPKRQRLQKLLKEYSWPILYGPVISSKVA